MSEWIRIRVKDFYKDAVGELEYTYVTREVMRKGLFFWKTGGMTIQDGNLLQVP